MPPEIGNFFFGGTPSDARDGTGNAGILKSVTLNVGDTVTFGNNWVGFHTVIGYDTGSLSVKKQH